MRMGPYKPRPFRITGWNVGRPTASTSVVPPRLTSFPREKEQLEFSSRSLVFPSDGDGLLRVWGAPGRPFVVRVRPGRSRWGVQAWGADAPTARAAVRAIFSFDHDLSAFYRLVRAERVLRGTERRFRGLRLPRDANLFESLLHAVIGQQLSVVAANTLKRRLIDATSAYEAADGHEVPRVPTPDELDRLGIDGLRRVGLSRVKSSSLLSLAAAERAGALRSERFDGVPTDEAVERLDEMPGVGRWTAENALLRGTGRTDLFVAGDLGVRKALAAYREVPFSADEERARAWADARYPGWGSYATLYLWRRWVADGAPSE